MHVVVRWVIHSVKECRWLIGVRQQRSRVGGSAGRSSVLALVVKVTFDGGQAVGRILVKKTEGEAIHSEKILTEGRFKGGQRWREHGSMHEGHTVSGTASVIYSESSGVGWWEWNAPKVVGGSRAGAM